MLFSPLTSPCLHRFAITLTWIPFTLGKTRQDMCVYFFNYRVSHHLNTGDLYQQPFRIAFPMVQRCCHNNTSPFQIQGGSNNSREGIGSAERRDQTLAVSSLKTSLTSSLPSNGVVIVLRCVLFGWCEWVFPAWARAEVLHQLSDFPANS